MAQHSRAGERALAADLVDVGALVRAYHDVQPDPSRAEERVAFGTSGHRGSSLRGSFQDAHVAALTQAVVELRAQMGVDGPLFVGGDSHALSSSALDTAREVLAAHEVDARYAPANALVATPLISHAILQWNSDPRRRRADGIILTPSHNPPDAGGFKYNPVSGGPAEPELTSWIEERANALLAAPEEIARVAGATGGGTNYDFSASYARDLDRVVDIDAIRRAGVKIAVDPLGGAALPVWRAIRDIYRLDISILNEEIDPRFSFMHLDHDGAIRMDCSSPFAMRGVVERVEGYDLGVGNDPDADRHGIVTARGLMNPNHFLAVAVDHLLRTRTSWSPTAAIGRTVVTSALLDRVAASHGRAIYEVPVGFKWFVEGMFNGTLAFGGEESAGASFVDFEGRPWSTDKDGVVMGLLAAEIVATRGQSLDACWDEIVAVHGQTFYARRDTPASLTVRQTVKTRKATDVARDTLAGQAISAVRTEAAGNGAAIGGLKIETEGGWVAMRPSGTEDILKVYAESFVSAAHLEQLLNEAEEIVEMLAPAGS